MTISIEKIRVPTFLLVLLAYGIFLFSPLCLVEVEKSEWSSWCSPPDTCVEKSGYMEVQPPLLVLSNGFTWKVTSNSVDAGVVLAYSANPGIALVFLLFPVLVVLPLTFLKGNQDAGRKAGMWRHVVLPRGCWRTCLWLIGMGFLLLSAFWAWNYLIYYGTMMSIAVVDPLLTSTIGTFLMSGLGFATMMLAVRSRAIWPVGSEDVEE